MTLRKGNNVIAKKTIFFRNPWTQGWGLRFRTPAPDTAYLFVFKRALRLKFSMWFVFTPIDVYFLDEKRRVIDLKRDFRPFTTYTPSHSFSYAVETRPGLLSLKEGDTVRF